MRIKIIFSIFFLFQLSSSAAKQDLDIIMENIRSLNLYSPDYTVIESYLNLMKEDGSFTDIDYTVTSKSGWTPHNHYFRLMDMVNAYVNPSCLYFSVKDLYMKIIKGLDYWMTDTPIATNWWHTQIEEPQYFGLMLILMKIGDEKIPSSIETRIIERWRNNGSNPAKRSGSNRSDIALHWMYYACLTNDSDLLKTAMKYLFEPVAYTNGEGIQVDNSFFQHGQQLYIMGYGEAFLESVLQAAYCVAGTQYKLSDEKLVILRDFILNSWSQCIRGDAANWNSMGRQLARVDYLRDHEGRSRIISMMIDVDREHENDYLKIKDRILGTAMPSDGLDPYHVHFFRGDYSVHVRKPYNFSTRMVSSRTCRQEYGNGENLKNYYLSDGATEISRTGNEYTNIMPLWDWNKIPGVTAPVLDTIPRTPELWSVYGTSDFAGGVSDSIYGCSTYKFFDEYSGVNTGASKGWFFFDDEIVCLGAGIKSGHEDVRTTINQCWGTQLFSVGTTSGITTFEGNIDQKQFDEGCTWVLHDSIGYYFPDRQSVLVENRKKTGNWRWISTTQEDKDLEGKVFTLSLKHPSQPENSKYSYIVIPGTDEESMSAYSGKSQIDILANTDSVQVVRHRGMDLYECIFYKACTFKHDDLSIHSLQPCALLVRPERENIAVHVADPGQQKGLMQIGVKGQYMGGMKYGACDFSDIDTQYAGMTKSFIIKKDVTGIQSVVSNPVVAYSDNPYSFKFNKRYTGKYILSNLRGVVEREQSFDADHVDLETALQKGVYVLSLYIEGQKSLVKKITVK